MTHRPSARDRADLYRQAEAALTFGKRHGRTLVTAYDPERHAPPVVERPANEVAADIKRVATVGALRAVFQPIYDLRNGQPRGFEGLIRPQPGNAGLRLLSQLKFDIVKIDLSLVQGGAVRATSQEVVRTLKDLADRWGALVIAEGIETPEQLQFLRSLGIPAGQGHLLGRPVESPSTGAVDLDALMRSSGDWLADRLRAVPA